MAQRDETITMAKAFAIMMMVAAHAGLCHPARQFVYMFHMPLFFFCSGFCFKPKWLGDARGFVLRRLKGLYVPCVKWSLLFLIMHNVFFRLHIYDATYGFGGTSSALYGCADFIRRAFRIVFFMGGHEQLLGGYWFLRTLLVASVLGFAAIRWIPKKAIGGGILLIISVLSKALNANEIAVDTMAAAFFLAGHWYSSHRRTGCRTAAGALLVVLAGSLLLPEGMWEQSARTVLPYAFVATAGSVMALKAANVCDMRLRNGFLRRALSLIGDHTLEILTWHFLCFKIVSLAIILAERRPIEQLAYFPVIPAEAGATGSYTPWWPLYFLAGVGVPVIFVAVRNHFRKARKAESSS